MGENDCETMGNVTMVKYDFDSDSFDEVSDEAKNFIKSLLIKDTR